MMTADEHWVRTREAAEMLGVCAKTVRLWGAAGRLDEQQDPDSGERLYKRRELRSLLRELYRPPPRGKRRP